MDSSSLNYRNKLKNKNILSPLNNENTLEVYKEDKLIFSNKGKWLMPLFELEDFFESIKSDNNIIGVHDTAIGKAAVVLLIRIGVKEIHGNLVSRLAVNYVNEYNSCHSEDKQILLIWDNIVDRLMCATEAQLSDYSGCSESEIDEMYFLLRQRGRLVWGVSLNVENLSFIYGNIHNLNFNMKPGDHLMIEGENGAGKSTLLKLIAGIYKPVSGKILIDGKSISKLPEFTIGYVPQFTDNVEYSLSVEEVTGLGLKCRKQKKSGIINKALERTSALHLAGRSFSSLSGGEKQKVSLARCLAQNAKIILLDEPTASLDEENRKMVIDIVRSLTVTEIPTIIIATHDKDLVSLPGWNVLNL